VRGLRPPQGPCPRTFFFQYQHTLLFQLTWQSLAPTDGCIFRCRMYQVRVLEPEDYTDSWFNTRESTDMFGFTKPGPEKVHISQPFIRLFRRTSYVGSYREKHVHRMYGIWCVEYFSNVSQLAWAMINQSFTSKFHADLPSLNVENIDIGIILCGNDSLPHAHTDCWRWRRSCCRLRK